MVNKNKYKKHIVKLLLAIFAISAVASSTTLADDYMYVKATHLNVRATGTTKSKIIAVVDNGYKVTILESTSNGWKKVLLENGQVGYVSGHFLVTEEPYYEKVISSRYTIKSGTAFMRGFDLVRKVAVLNQGDTLEVTSEKVYLNRWIQVRVTDAKHPRYNGRTGYVAKRLLSPVEGYVYETPANQETPVAIEEAQVAKGDVPSDLFPELNSAPAENTGSTTDTINSGSTTDDTNIDDEFSKLLEGL